MQEIFKKILGWNKPVDFVISDDGLEWVKGVKYEVHASSGQMNFGTRGLFASPDQARNCGYKQLHKMLGKHPEEAQIIVRRLA